MLDLAHPWLVLLAPLPVLARLVLPPRATGGAYLTVPDRIGCALLAAGRSARSVRARDPRLILLWLIWGLLVLALSGPRTLTPVSALKVSGRDLAIVLDLSGSMVRDDFYLDGAPVTRLAAVKSVGADFARRRGGDRVALILFGSAAYYAAPFTFDVASVARRIEAAQIGISGRATNISDGLGLALKRLERSQARSKVVILLSDGSNNAGMTTPRDVAGLAVRMGVRVHTIALGPKDKESAAPGERGVVDAATLRAISEISEGKSFRVRDTDDLVEVGRALDRLETTESDGLAAEIYREFWIWPAAVAGLLALLLVWREAR